MTFSDPGADSASDRRLQVGRFGAGADFGGFTFTINDSEFRFGDFINALITFLSVAAAVYFFVVVPYQKYDEARGIRSGTKPCPECTTDIAEGATRCPHCTAQLGTARAV